MSSRGGAGREERGISLTFCITKILVGSKTKSNVLLNAVLGNGVQAVWLASDMASIRRSKRCHQDLVFLVVFGLSSSPGNSSGQDRFHTLGAG